MRIEVFNYLPEEAGEIRRKVFIEEQGFAEEFDEIDHVAKHFVIYDANEMAVGTCRVFWSDAVQSYVLGRLAVLKEYRGMHFGAALVKAACSYIKEEGGAELRLHAQCRITVFYEALGFEAFGEIEDDQGCPHIWMKKGV